MDYTSSLDNVVHQATGQRMHQDTGALPTVWSAKDANSIIWSLMEVIKAAGITPQEFNTDMPASYSELLNSIKKLASTATTPAQGDVSKLVATTEFVKKEFQSLLSQIGWEKIPDATSPSGYRIKQWGYGTVVNGSALITLPIAFPNAILGGFANERNATAWDNIPNGRWVNVFGVDLASSTKTTLAVRGRTLGVNAIYADAGVFEWQAWGN